MNDFNIIDIENEEFNILILMMTCDSPFDYITEIAEQLNYTNAQNFIRFFSKSTGVTPGKFRKLY